MSLEQNTFWMIPRSVLNADAAMEHEQRALIAYNILFGGPLIISDSDLINNRYLRRGVEAKNGFVHELFEREYIRVARRTLRGNPVSLSEVAESIGRKPGGLLKGIVVGYTTDLEIIEKVAAPLYYELTEAQPRYEAEVVRVFRKANSFTNLLPSILSKTIAELCEEPWTAEKITWSSFDPTSDIWNVIHTRSGDQTLREQYGQRVFDIARGPYSTFLPSTLKVGATYSSEDEVGIDLWRDRYGLAKTDLDRITVRAFGPGPAETVAGLSLLTVSEIERLRNSEALIAYEDGCDAYNYKRVDLVDIKNAFFAYRSEVNAAIISALKGNSTNESLAYEFKVSESALPKSATMLDNLCYTAYEEYNSFLTYSCEAATKIAMNSLTFGQYGLFQYFYKRVQNKVKEPKVRASSGVVEALRKEAQQQHSLEELLAMDASTIIAVQRLNEASRDVFSYIA